MQYIPIFWDKQHGNVMNVIFILYFCVLKAANLLTLGQSCEHVGTHLLAALHACMKQGRIETITTRIISTTFIVVALAVFKPFGLDAWQWQAYVHLAALGVIGFSI